MHCRFFGVIGSQDPIVATGRPYHKNCFSCNECHKVLAPNNFKEKGNKIFCPDCYHNIYSPKCTGCKKPITTGVGHAGRLLPCQTLSRSPGRTFIRSESGIFVF